MSWTEPNVTVLSLLKYFFGIYPSKLIRGYIGPNLVDGLRYRVLSRQGLYCFIVLHSDLSVGGRQPKNIRHVQYVIDVVE